MEFCRTSIQCCSNLVTELGLHLEDGADLHAFKRIVHICNALFRRPDLPEPMIKDLGRLLNTMCYQPPWDNEIVILDSLLCLSNICYLYIKDNADIATAFRENLKDRALTDEIALWREI